MTKQEMFNLAVRGLRSQGWVRAFDTVRGGCVYETSEGLRCAWGWVDRELTSAVCGTVGRLYDDGVGLAAKLDAERLAFAAELQRIHDYEELLPSMEARFRELGERHNLEWPND